MYIDIGGYKLRDKERSKESAYVLVGFLARPFVSFVSHIARYAPSSTDKSSSLRNQKSTQPYFRTPLRCVYRTAIFFQNPPVFLSAFLSF